MAIPPQLAEVLSDHAAAVQEFCNMAPGIPWTNQTLDDMLDNLDKKGTPSEQSNTLYLQSRFDATINGIKLIEVRIMRQGRKVKKTWKRCINAAVYYEWDRGVMSIGPDYDKDFDFDRKGLKDAISFVQEKVQNIKRRGLCNTCLTAERPRKRLRVGDTGLCSTCLLQKAVF
jgi:hypothetical protein